MLETVLGGRYRLTAELGSGGFGQTFLAEDVCQPEALPCVVKQFKPASQDPKFLETARRLFDTEVATLKRLGQHDQIPELLDCFEADREFYLVQEFIDGQSLSEILLRQRCMSEAEVLKLLGDVLGVLEFVHTNHVIHRDIKPGNLMQRQHDGKFVLIDFGAVKEIETQLLSAAGQTDLTIGIGTQGYMPNEQLAGKPRYSSDIYALGMTAIHALTGYQPSQFPESEAAELLWQDQAEVSSGLAFILDCMVRSHVSQRYRSVRDVLQALHHLAEMPTGSTDLPPSLLLPDYLRVDRTELEPSRRKLVAGLRVVAIAAAAVTGLLVSVRQFGWVEPLELQVFDQFVQIHHRAAADPRILIVEINESDLRSLQRTTPDDQSLAQVLSILQQAQPRVIGLDLHRDLPQAPGHTALLRQLQSTNLVVITDLGASDDTRIPPPLTVPAERVGFNDIAIDADGVVRRNLLFATNELGTFHAFSLRVALQYLAAQGISPENSAANPADLQIGDTRFVPLARTSGGYQFADAAGYQILLHYRSPDAVAKRVSFTDLLNGRVKPGWIRDKIVLVGTTAPSGKDLFFTPYSSAQQIVPQMPGVVIHAQMVSQVLTTVLDRQPLFWFWSDSIEILWMGGWAVVGGILAWYLRHPIVLGIGCVTALAFIGGVGLLLFVRQGWVPVATPTIALILTGASVAAYQMHQVRQHDPNPV